MIMACKNSPSLVKSRLASAEVLSDIALQLVVFVEHDQPDDALLNLLDARCDVRIFPVSSIGQAFWHNEAEADALVLYCPDGGFSSSAVTLISQYLEAEIIPPALAIFYSNKTDAAFVRENIAVHVKGVIPLLPAIDTAHPADYDAITSIDAWFQDIRFGAKELRRDRIRWLKHEARLLADSTALESHVKKYITEPVYQAGKDARNLIQNLYKKGKQWW